MYTSAEQHKMAITEEVGQAQTDAQSFTAPPAISQSIRATAGDANMGA